MPNTDITYCTRDCGNMECNRNKEHLFFYEFTWMASFDDCKEWKEVQDE